MTLWMELMPEMGGGADPESRAGATPTPEVLGVYKHVMGDGNGQLH